LTGLGYVALAIAGPVPAARVWGAAERLREEIGAPLHDYERARYERELAAARAAAADEAAFALAWKEGRGMTIEAAIELALDAPRW
jgi:hypothetical protein